MRAAALRTLASLAWLFAAVLADAPARAQTAEPPVAIHGFGSWAYGRTDKNVYLAGEPGGDFDKDEFGLAIAAAVSDRLRVTGQITLAESQQRHETEVELDYAFAEWRFSDSARVRVGKAKQPFGLQAEVFRVGTLRPFLDLPQGVYGGVGLTGVAYEGIGFTGRLALGRWTMSYDAYGGGVELEEFEATEKFLRGEPVSNETSIEAELTKNVVGGKLVVEPPLDGASVGLSAYAGDEEGADFRHVLGVHAEYLSGPWSIRSEFAHETVRDHLYVNGFYVEAARRLGAHWQVAGQYNRLTTELPDVPQPVAPSLLDHREGVVGLNYWFHPSLVVKSSYHLIQGNRLAAPPADDLAAAVASGRLGERTRLFQVGAQFSF